MQRLAGNLVVGVAGRAQRLVDVEHEHVHRPIVGVVQIQRGKGLLARCVGSDLREPLAVL